MIESDYLVSTTVTYKQAGVIHRTNNEAGSSNDGIKKKKSSIMRNANPFTKFGMLSRGRRDDRSNSKEELLKWADSFDCLLTSKEGVELFRLFLQREFSDENIEFWLACEDYKKQKGPKQMQLKAQEICQNFVFIQSPKEVNLDSKTRELTIAGAKEANRGSFDMAQARIVALMEKDSYPRFLKSDVYLNLLKKS